MASVPLLPLPGGRGIPALGYGLGTAWFKSAGTDREADLGAGVTAALDAGFTHIDEAEMYENEAATGKAITQWLARTGTPRSSLFVTGKVLSVDEPGVEAICRQSLARMGVEYFDLYLIHAPFDSAGEPFKRPLAEIWKDMEALVDAGLVRAIGVSNWRICDLEEIFDGARIKPACNQVEAHPYLQQGQLVRWCQEHDMLVTAYSPLGSIVKEELQGGPVDAVAADIAQRLGRTPAQVLLRWNLQTGRGVLSTTSKKERMQEYLGIFDFELSEQDVEKISAAGASRPRRAFWTQCPQFPADPTQAEE